MAQHCSFRSGVYRFSVWDIFEKGESCFIKYPRVLENHGNTKRTLDFKYVNIPKNLNSTCNIDVFCDPRTLSTCTGSVAHTLGGQDS